MKDKKNKNTEEETQKSNVELYELHTDAVDRLINANEENSPEVDDVEIKKYKKDKLAKIPVWLKANFIKFWFNGAVCFFFFWGLGIYMKDIYDQILVVGIAMGIINDLLVNNIFRSFDDGERNYTKWTMFSTKKYWTFFANIVYAFLILLLVIITYNGVNIFINNATSAPDTNISIGVEPFLFGLLYLLFDLAALGIKHLVVKMIDDANKKLSEQNKNKNNDK